jgi:carotenoid cleavage dioxygenase-like enzyme
MTKEYEYVFLNVFLPEKSDGSKYIFHGLNALAMHSKRTGKTRFFYAGDDSLVQEPIFIPREKDAAEGDGWVISLMERRAD